ncbi:protein S100-P-like [Phyllostomus hastatus]|uniref:protein S100-P-like n=1 Tax=Phyllostomus hastatus TaxID=9423 RepID=UPI001E6817AA|nr:protein S100-P-like [Phyllostomus hastatus]
MLRLEMAMALIIEVFTPCMGTDGTVQSLNKWEMKVLLEKKLLGFLQSGRDKEAMDKLPRDLDADGDTMVDFNKFIEFVAAITTVCHSCFQQKGLN